MYNTKKCIKKNYNFIKAVIVAMVVPIALAATSVAAHAGQVSVILDYEPVAFTDQSGYPFVDENARTQVPLRQTMERFGATVGWDQENQVASVEKDGTMVLIPAGMKYIVKNGDMIATDTVAVVANSRVYLPIRPVLEAFGAEVNWSQSRSEEAGGTVVAYSYSPKKKLSAHFLDVGQGDSIFIDFGEYEILIDAGEPDQGRKVVDYIGPHVNGNLDMLIATHVHADHIGGIPAVLAAFQVDRIIDSGDTYTTKSFQRYADAVAAEPNCVYAADADTTIDLNDGATLNILDVMDGDENYNNNSVIARLVYGNVSMLFMGDAEAKAEFAGLPFFAVSDILKVGHHGSFTSSTKELVEAVRPGYGVISAGRDNLYRHPHFTALNNLWRGGATLYGTYASGDIFVMTDGETFTFSVVDLYGRLLAPLT